MSLFRIYSTGCIILITFTGAGSAWLAGPAGRCCRRGRRSCRGSSARARSWSAGRQSSQPASRSCSGTPTCAAPGVPQSSVRRVKIFSWCIKYFSYLEECPGLLHPPLPHLEHAQVVVALGVVIVGRQGQLEALQIHKSRWYRTRYLAS